jgi:hypothetical protein
MDLGGRTLFRASLPSPDRPDLASGLEVFNKRVRFQVDASAWLLASRPDRRQTHQKLRDKVIERCKTGPYIRVRPQLSGFAGSCRASLDKLAIRGIRAFDDKHTNVIQFQSPVTVIVGTNGTGKTVSTSPLAIHSVFRLPTHLTPGPL